MSMVRLLPPCHATIIMGAGVTQRDRYREEEPPLLVGRHTLRCVVPDSSVRENLGRSTLVGTVRVKCGPLSPHFAEIIRVASPGCRYFFQYMLGQLLDGI